mmetsp:Transcript_67395/g.217610  ORF Transcript_67395/g.217610 Transcript_67395/m.217610 type:complete len:351 (-) Transcript_67395:11-1063(-)
MRAARRGLQGQLLLDLDEHPQGGGQANKPVHLRILQHAWSIAEHVARRVRDAVLVQQLRQEPPLLRAELVEGVAEAVAALVVVGRAEAEEPRQRLVLWGGEAGHGLGAPEQHEGVVRRSGVQRPELLQRVQAGPEALELGLVHEERALEALGAKLPAHLGEDAEAEEGEAIVAVRLQLLLHDHEVRGRGLRLQELAELEVHAQRVHDEVLVLPVQPGEGGHNLGLGLQDVGQRDVVHVRVEARHHLVAELLDLPERVDRHEDERGVHGVLRGQLHRLRHPLLDPGPGGLRELAVVLLLLDEGLVLPSDEPVDGEHRPEGLVALHPINVRRRVEVRDLRENPEDAGLKAIL